MLVKAAGSRKTFSPCARPPSSTSCQNLKLASTNSPSAASSLATPAAATGRTVRSGPGARDTLDVKIGGQLVCPVVEELAHDQ